VTPRGATVEAPQPNPSPYLKTTAQVLGVTVAALGALVLAGWAFGVEALKSVLPGYLAMKPNTALALGLAGVSVALQTATAPSASGRRLGRLLAAGTLALGALTLVEWALHVPLGIDELLFRDEDAAPGTVPGRVPFGTAVALLLLGAALLLLDREGRRGGRPAQALALVASIVPLHALIGYLYGIEPRYGVNPYSDIALHAGVALGLLCVAVLLARAEGGIVRVVVGGGPAGFTARRMLAATLAIPLVLGWFILVAGLRAGHYEALVGATFVVVSAVITGGALVWWNAREIARVDDARTRAEEALRVEGEWLRTTLASIGDGVVAAGEDGRVKNLNAVAEALTGWPSVIAAGRPLQEVLPLRAVDGTPALDPAAASVADLPRGAVLVPRAGGELRVEGTVAPIRDARGRRAGVVVVFRDIRDRLRVEEERARLLANERAARAEAERASRAKDEFIATLSHELRTPLNSVLGGARLLRLGKLDADGVRRAVDAVERGATTQAQIVDDLLDVSRIVRGQLALDVRPVDLVPVVEAAIEIVRPAAVARDITIATALDPRAGGVSGDSGRLQQVAWNLLSNAIKFTPQGGRVDVSVRTRDGEVELEVRDDGSGISPEFLPRVFDRFTQADSSTTRAHGGLGLGLAIVRHLVEAHGGTVGARSDGPGQGSCFTVRLPAATARPRLRAAAEARTPLPVPPPPRPSGALDRVRILVVDDDRDTLEVMRQLLEQAGAEVSAVASADEALQSLERRVPDVLVSDIGMPGLDGYALIEAIRERSPEKGGRVPAAALTAFTQAEHRERALRAGFQLYLPKPIEPGELTEAVAKLAGRGASRA
jgi:PAS domain S-box-containing protein